MVFGLEEMQKGEKTEIAVVADSPAEKAELKRDDIILEFDNTKITKKYSLAKTILQYSPEDKVSLKILRDGKEIIVEITLSERED